MKGLPSVVKSSCLCIYNVLQQFCFKSGHVLAVGFVPQLAEDCFVSSFSLKYAAVSKPVAWQMCGKDHLAKLLLMKSRTGKLTE